MWGRGNTREFAEATPSALEEPFSAGGGSLEIEQSVLERAGWLPPGRGVRIKLQAINPDLGAFVAQQEAEVVQLLASRSARAFYSPDCDYVVDPERFILRIAGDGTPAECAGPVLYRGSTFGYRFGSICFGQMSFDFTDNSDDLTIQHETLLRAVGFVRQLLTPH